MTRPGTDVVILDSAPPRSAPTGTDAAFMVGLTAQGPLGPTLFETLSSFRTQTGARVTYGAAYDAAEVFFREGGSRLFFSRVVGPSAVASFRNLVDGAAASSIRVTAASPGAWGSLLTVQVATVGSGFTLTIRSTDASVAPIGIIDASPTLADKNAAVDWGAASKWVDVSIIGAGGNPATLGASALSSGTDDRASVTDTEWGVAISRFGKGLGPGRILAPGATSSTTRTNLLAHAAANNRRALLDATDTATIATVTAEPAAIRSAAGNDNARYGAIYAPWVRINSVVPGSSTREVAPSALIAGLMARSILAGNPVGRPAANINGQSRTAISLAQPYAETDTPTLYAAGVNPIIASPNLGIINYGDTTLADPLVYPLWVGDAADNTVMAITARADAILQNHVFAVIDGAGLEFTKLAGEFVGMLMPFWEEGSLYGATFDDAARVDTGPKVNTNDTIAARELHALVALKTSPAADWVQLQLVRFPTSETL